MNDTRVGSNSALILTFRFLEKYFLMLHIFLLTDAKQNDL